MAENCAGACSFGVRSVSGDRQSRVLEERRGGASKGDSAVVALRFIHWREARQHHCAYDLETHKEPRFAASVHFRFPSRTPTKIIHLLIPSPPVYLCA